MQQHPPARTAEPALGSPDEPAWLIAPERGLLLAATRTGLERLGLPGAGPDAPIALDRAMPALTALSEMLASDDPASGAQTTRTLVFWTPRGPLTLDCLCRRQPRPDGGDAILVRALPPETAGTPPAAADTGATLSKIADRIRAELRARSAAPSAPAVPASPPPAAGAPPAEAPASAAPPDQLAKLAHELRTPVAAIASMSEILRDERFGPLADERYRAYARSIHDSARHMLAVIENMLQRPDSDSPTGSTAPLTFADLDLNAISSAIAQSIAPLVRDAGLDLETRLADRLPMVVADQRCIRQILLNLLTNAMKFTPRGGRIAVATRYDTEGRLTLEVSDTGRGIPEADLTRIRAGQGADRPDAGLREGGGRGLGLPLVQALAAANGARIEITSAPGQGTRVSLIFPADRVIPV